MRSRLFALLVVFCASVFSFEFAAAEDDLFFASVGSGGLDGGYNRTATEICKIVNDASRATLRCSPEMTIGSIYNLKGLAKGELEFALVQSDWLYEAFVGGKLFSKDGANESLRTVTGLYVEAFTLLARRDADIDTFRDLVGKRVDIGNPTSGRRATMEVAMEVFGIEKNDFADALELSSSNIVPSLCDGRVDAVVLVVGHPSPLVARAIKECDVSIIPVFGSEIDELLEKAPYYRETLLKSRLYQGQHVSIPTFGVTATLVTSANVPVKIVETVASVIVKDWEQLKKREPILANSPLSLLQSTNISAPLHPGAVEAFRKTPLRD